MADTYSPTSSMKAAARRALKWKADGKAKGAGTPVGWGRATDIVNGSAMSLSTVKRMFSFFSRHEVDKKGKGFYDGPEFPSNGRIMWDAWGGDAGFSWSRAITQREKKKLEKVWQGTAFDLRKQGVMDNLEKNELIQLISFYKQKLSDVELELLKRQLEINSLNSMILGLSKESVKKTK